MLNYQRIMLVLLTIAVGIFNVYGWFISKKTSHLQTMFRQLTLGRREPYEPHLLLHLARDHLSCAAVQPMDLVLLTGPVTPGFF